MARSMHTARANGNGRMLLGATCNASCGQQGARMPGGHGNLQGTAMRMRSATKAHGTIGTRGRNRSSLVGGGVRYEKGPWKAPGT